MREVLALMLVVIGAAPACSKRDAPALGPAPIPTPVLISVGTYTPVLPVNPTTPPWYVAPPTGWTPSNLALLTGLLFG